MPIQTIGSLTNVPDRTPLVSEWAHDVSRSIVHRFPNATAMGAFLDTVTGAGPMEGALAVTTNDGQSYQRVGGNWEPLGGIVRQARVRKNATASVAVVTYVPVPAVAGYWTIENSGVKVLRPGVYMAAMAAHTGASTQTFRTRMLYSLSGVAQPLLRRASEVVSTTCYSSLSYTTYMNANDTIQYALESTSGTISIATSCSLVYMSAAAGPVDIVDV